MKLSTTAACLAAVLLSPVQAKGDDLPCFKKQGDDYIEYSDKIYAASPNRDCENGTTECTANSENIHISEKRFLNVTTNKADEVFDVISEATGLAFDESLSAEAGEGVRCSIDIGRGDKVYVGYSPGFKCVNGTMGSCVEDVKEGLPVKACYPARTEEQDDKVPVAQLQCLIANSTNTPDVKFKPVEGSAPGLMLDIKLLSLFSFLAVGGGFWAS